MADVQVSGGQVRAGPISAPVIPLLLIGFGAYLMWFGTHYWRQDLKWPSDPVKSVLQGKGLPASTPAQPESAQLDALVSQAGGYQGPVPKGAAQNTAKLLLGKFGWPAAQMGSLDKLWEEESGWNPKARNTGSGAFGIAQALGHGTTDTAAPDGTNEYGPVDGNWYGMTPAEMQQANAGNARWQIQWGLSYIASKYGNPDNAYAFETSHVPNWY